MRKDNYYYETFQKLVDYSCQAAELLHKIVTDYNTKELDNKIKEMHAIEHTADGARHEMMQNLLKEFITPIEREDIVTLADYIDTVTDTIEDVLLRLYMYNIQEITEYAQDMTQIIIKCCDLLRSAFEEFPNFRKSKKLHELIVRINELEEEGDALYTKAIRALYLSDVSCKEIVGWDNTYHYLEKCCDACENVAEVIEDVIMKNT
ncbi:MULTISPECIES: DUF47 family protein [Tepidanaerobacter]|uniref:DUF47 family protein n=1 Tax=Tepidanaerobacter syntrophicus TaxID=224999 RepID=A0A0U9HC98_9FIRM|nr:MULTISPECIES: DUF47 family protein [Tepidanaerobacter]GAQ24086.1 hypothetical protein TSYNT_171 [Tepidanaerobacter syntrophicus]GLI19537.1 hypothetical protein TSYNTROPHJE_13500 [Tepidanaerobacter syntrophicus]GLI51737.1 hypothetical protein TSYNTROOL_18230 [Tepidanaerobacter syntrophicus]HHV82376.1 DUF47 family protein [Tepidanaerobacter syntrophicus]